MISWQRGKTAPLGVFAMAKSLSCATHVKSLSRHKVLQIDAAVDAAPWPFMAAPVAVEERNLQLFQRLSKYAIKQGLFYRSQKKTPLYPPLACSQIELFWH